jgi:chemotaxis protein MotB
MVANSSDARQPIIVKRIKKGAHGHHGGAWKIAYADFVTAMMAFFLLMWLLGSTTKGELQGIADYFRMPLKVGLTGGSGAGETGNVIQGGSRGLTPINSELQTSRPTFEKPDRSKKRPGQIADESELERKRLALLKREIEEILFKIPSFERIRDQIRLDITTEGLRIQIVDGQSRPMFDLGSAIVKDYMRQLLREIGAVLNSVDHRVTLAGHTDAKLYLTGDRGYSNWELSADRANASRRELIAGGMDDKKILRVVGVGASVMLNADDPNDAINRRISIIVMNKATESKVVRELGKVEVRDAEALEVELTKRNAETPDEGR